VITPAIPTDIIHPNPAKFMNKAFLPTAHSDWLASSEKKSGASEKAFYISVEEKTLRR